MQVLPEPPLAEEQARHAATLPTLEGQVREQFEALLRAQPAVADELRPAPAALDDPLQLAYLIAATSPLPVAARQAVLEADGAVGKLGVLLPLLTQINAALGVGPGDQRPGAAAGPPHRARVPPAPAAQSDPARVGRG